MGRNKELFVIFREEGTRGKGKSTRDLLPGAIGKIWRGSGENGIRGRLPLPSNKYFLVEVVFRRIAKLAATLLASLQPPTRSI